MVVVALPLHTTIPLFSADDVSTHPEDMDVVLVLCWISCSRPPSTTAINAAPTASKANDVGSTPVAPAVLALTSMERMDRINISGWTSATLNERQLLALQVIKTLDIPSGRYYLAGAASYHHTIKLYCEEQLSRAAKYEMEQLEDDQVVRALLALVLGSQTADQFANVPWGSLSHRVKVPDASVLHALQLLCHSKTATNCVPLIVQTICVVTFGTAGFTQPRTTQCQRAIACRA